jgi:hypothetical protein
MPNILKINPVTGHHDYYNLQIFFNNLGTVIENTVSDPSILTPNIGDRYIPANPSIGDWLGQYPNIATWDGVQWVYYTPMLNDRVTITTGVNAGKVYYFDGTNWVEVVDPVNEWRLNGNVVGSEQFIGTLDNFSFPVRTNNLESFRVDTSQRILVGTTTTLNAFAKLQVRGGAIFDDSISLTTPTNFPAFTFNALRNNSFSARYSINSNFTNTFTNGTVLASNNTASVFNVNTFSTGTYDVNGANAKATWSRLTISNTGVFNQDSSAGGGSASVVAELLYSNATADRLSVNTSQLTISSGSVQDIAIVRSQTRGGSALGSITNLKFYEMTNAPGTNIASITNSYGFYVDSQYDTVAGFPVTNKFVFYSDSVAISRHRGDFEFLQKIKLRGLVNFVEIQANSGTSPYTMTLPTNIGTNGYVLQTDGVSQTSWVDPNINNIPEWIAAPLTSTSTGLQGQKAIDATWIYFCYADNLWARTSRDLTVW